MLQLLSTSLSQTASWLLRTLHDHFRRDDILIRRILSAGGPRPITEMV